MFTIEMLPGGYGDALWVEYGDSHSRTRVLIDGGAPGTGDVLRQKINALPVDQRRFELVVVTHIDLDHISGLLELLENEVPEGLVIDDFWFNGFRELPDPEGLLGPKQGERLSYWLTQHAVPHNVAFAEESIALPDDVSNLTCTELPQGMKLTLLSPTGNRLLRLRSEWERIIRGIELEPGEAGDDLAGHPAEHPRGVLGDMDIEVLAEVPFRKDDSRPNGSSIAFVAEFDGQSVLFTGDAFADDLATAIKRLLTNRGQDRLQLDAWKLSHHGGKKNTGPELIQLIDCQQFLVPTSGARYHHPNDETLARILVANDHARPVTFHFNYRSRENQEWDDEQLKDQWNFDVRYPNANAPGLKVELA